MSPDKGQPAKLSAPPVTTCRMSCEDENIFILPLYSSWLGHPWAARDACGCHPACGHLLFVACRNTTSLFLEAGPQRIGSKYKKVMFVEYEDASFKTRKMSQEDKGILGPVLKGEVGDQFKVRERLFSTEKDWKGKA